jgi:hypothetical protein
MKSPHGYEEINANGIRTGTNNDVILLRTTYASTSARHFVK